MHGPMNLCNPDAFSIRELAERVISLTGSRLPIVYRPLPTDDPTPRQPDILCAKKTFFWEPRVLLEKNLLKTIEYFDGLKLQSTQLGIANQP